MAVAALQLCNFRPCSTAMVRMRFRLIRGYCALFSSVGKTGSSPDVPKSALSISDHPGAAGLGTTTVGLLRVSMGQCVAKTLWRGGTADIMPAPESPEAAA